MDRGCSFLFFFHEVMQVVFVCVVLKFWWQDSLIITSLPPSLELQFAQDESLSVPSTPHAAAVNLLKKKKKHPSFGNPLFCFCY